ncbi:MAG: hypothetical protein WB580_16260 [Candidatus Binataceae bacterium]
MPPLGPGLAMAAGEASIGEDVCAQLTAPSNSNNGRTSSISRMMNPAVLFVLFQKGTEPQAGSSAKIGGVIGVAL